MKTKNLFLLSWAVFFLMGKVPSIHKIINDASCTEFTEEKAPSINYALEYNHKISGYNRDPKHTDLFYGKRDCIYLNGYWKLRKLSNTEDNPEDDLGMKEGFWRVDYNDSSWVDQYVPWDWNVAHPVYEEGTVLEPIWKPIWKLRKRKYKFSGVGWYRTMVKALENYKDKRVILHFERIDGEIKVWVNGVFIGENKSTSEVLREKGYQHSGNWLDRIEFDITKAINFGKTNTIAIRVYSAKCKC